MADAAAAVTQLAARWAGEGGSTLAQPPAEALNSLLLSEGLHGADAAVATHASPGDGADGLPAASLGDEGALECVATCAVSRAFLRNFYARCVTPLPDGATSPDVAGAHARCRCRTLTARDGMLLVRRANPLLAPCSSRRAPAFAVVLLEHCAHLPQQPRCARAPRAVQCAGLEHSPSNRVLRLGSGYRLRRYISGGRAPIYRAIFTAPAAPLLTWQRRPRKDTTCLEVFFWHSSAGAHFHGQNALLPRATEEPAECSLARVL
jgi:hypothetical protein